MTALAVVPADDTADAPFSIHALITEYLRASNDPDPDATAARLADAIPAEHVRDALLQLLRTVCSVRAASMRSANAAGTPATRREPSPSWKVKAIRDGWAVRLRERMPLADGWKFLEDCSADDLIACAQRRQEVAERNASRAAEYRAWAEEMQAARVKRFGDLPEHTLRDLLKVNDDRNS